MGNTIQCHIIENDEELINNLLSTMILSEIDCTTAYNKYCSCINNNSSRLHKEEYAKFINAILGNTKYRQYQELYFHNLHDAFPDEIVIGSLVIFLSKGVKEEKAKLLVRHYKSNSSFISITQFIIDIIRVNTTYCITTFNDCINKNNLKTMLNIYSDERINAFSKWIMNNYNELNTKANLKKHKSEGDIFIEENEEEKDRIIKEENIMLREFFDITYDQLKGDYIRNWLYENYTKEIPDKHISPCE